MAFPNYLKSDKPVELVQADFEKALTELSVTHAFHDSRSICTKNYVIFEIVIGVNCTLINYIHGNEDEYKDLLVDLSIEMQVSFEYNDDEPPPLEDDIPPPPPLTRQCNVPHPQPILAEETYDQPLPPYTTWYERSESPFDYTCLTQLTPDTPNISTQKDEGYLDDLPPPPSMPGPPFDYSHMFTEEENDDEDEDETIGVIERCGMEYYLQSCVPIKSMGLYLNNPDYVNAQLKYLSGLPHYVKRWPHIYANDSSGGW